ncbi:TetR/AcrR family transcriptional regulator [Devosia sp. 66-22]|uniref:TetR/AcrR family transcriptional regulator n=1 Tax=Devosia sp. 66-22 TaxID=1895753 RepID=UPI00092CA64A|nr:TetR/AcrR family transcriptional regulator [Devosia sp. 66-22]OJX46543.1 MAG: hypothetical protein BGO81_04075 [Devosia sp. 66-22]
MSVSEHFAQIDREKVAEADRQLHPGMDRRTQRTRQALHHALIELTLTKNYDEISVAEITDAANVGRSTFYAHFTDKDDLLRSGIGYLRGMLIHGADGSKSDDPFAFSSFLTLHLGQQKSLYRAMMRSSAGTIVLDTIRETLCDILRRQLRRTEPSDETTVQFMVGAYLAVVTWWLNRGAKEPAHEIDNAFRSLAGGAIGSRHPVA